MCGIFGVINTNEMIDEGRVLAARDVLAHRGPDDAGLYLSGTNASIHPNVALAHRRLSIIDLSPAAHQPMLCERREQSAERIAKSVEHRPFDCAQGDAAPRYVIVFNGEIYNYKSLLPSPPPKGEGAFKSNSDTKVILNLYAQYGKDCLHYLRGMFAFAIWDEQEKTLFAARDRFGIKPFYYLHNANPPDGEAGLSTGKVEFIFSSELKAIKHYKGNLTINDDALDAFLRTGSVPAPLTIYNEVAALLPGNYLEIKFVETKNASSLQSERKSDPSTFDSPDEPDYRQGRSGQAASHRDRQGDTLRVTIGKYWEFGEMMVNGKWLMDAGKKVLDSRLSADKAGLRENDRHKGINEQDKNTNRHTDPSNHASMHPYFHALRYDDNTKQKIRTALLDAIKTHLVADVEVGAFLSGGIDSTAIVSLMRQCGQEKIKTVSVVFPGNKLDESKYARLAAKTYNTEHIEIPFYEKDLLDDFENIMASMDQPTIDGINTYFVSKAAKLAGLKVVLSGLGGDELFGGYPSFNLIPKYQRIKNLPFAKMFMKFAAPLLKNKLPAKAIHYMKNPDEPNAEYKLVRGLFTNGELQAMGWNHATMHPYSHAAGLNEEAWMHENEWMHGKVKVSYLESCYYMRNQLLRDSDVFSMAHSIELRVPFVDHRLYETVLPYLDSAYDKNFPKKMLVEAVGDIPDEIVDRPKMGFTFPFEDWIRNGELNNKIQKAFKNLNDKKMFNKEEIDKYFIESNLNKTHWSRIWTLFILESFSN